MRGRRQATGVRSETEPTAQNKQVTQKRKRTHGKSIRKEASREADGRVAGSR